MRTSISPLSGATSTAVTPAWFRWRGSAPASSSATATYTRWHRSRRPSAQVWPKGTRLSCARSVGVSAYRFVLLLHREVQRSVPDGVGGRFVRACAVHAMLARSSYGSC